MRLVLAVCQHGSFGKAAKALGMSQPTLSKAISRVEYTLGVSLFDRGGYAARPTAFAKHIAERATLLLTQAASVSRELQLISSGQLVKFKIGVGPGVGADFSVRMIAGVLKKFPEMRVEILHRSGERLSELLQSRQLDFMIVNRPHIGPMQGIEIRSLFTAPMIGVARPGHVLQKRKRLTLAKMLEFPVASPGPYAIHRPLLIPALPDHCLPNLDALICTDYDVLKALIYNTDHVSVGPPHMFAEELAEGSLIKLPVNIPLSYYCIAASTVEGLHLPVIQEFFAVANDYVKQSPALAQYALPAR